MFIEVDLRKAATRPEREVWGQILGSGWDSISGKLDEKLQELSTVRGEFAFVYREAGEKTLYALRDPLGVAPLYYAELVGRIILSTSLTRLCDRLKGYLSLDKVYCQLLAWDMYFDTSSTAFLEIKRLPPGHLLVATTDGCRVLKVHTHPLADLKMNRADAVARLRQQLVRSTINRTKNLARTGVFLSGGFDSSLLTSILCRHGQPETELHSYSIHFPVNTPAWNGDLDLLLSQKSWKHHALEYRPGLFDLDRGMYFYTPNLQMLKPLLATAAQTNVKVVMTGLGGDDLFTYSPLVLGSLLRMGRPLWWFRTLLKHSSWGPTLLLRNSFSSFLPGAWRLKWHRLVRNRLAFDSKIQKQADARFAEFHAKRKLPDALPHVRNAWDRFFGAGAFAFGLEQEQEIAQLNGVRLTYPLIDYDLVLFFLNIPAVEHVEGFDNKKLLREAAAGLLMDEIRLKRNNQDYNPVRNESFARQSELFTHRAATLSQAEEISANISDVDTLLKLNYIYTCSNYTGDHRDEPSKVHFQEAPQNLPQT